MKVSNLLIFSLHLLTVYDRSLSTDEFVPEQHFFPKYSIDNACEVEELGDGRRSHPRRDKTTWFG